jgi:outer membrane protein assembly factor BamB
VDSSPAVFGGIVYIGTDNDAVYAFNAVNGKS